ncbi:hypothetical protein BBBOND_0309690 [Babesia bigemina]|uniref:Uncharacterized protein n=1 Tax=Babesia bigemina TaxID=5866 RepID=A0A061D8M5_BABBI|nr:hypothetical protein BBBOND_0309690 [Babesia bigemina]CDR97066.1 hypothetical protein BBBOND_0309690 [Babesia bigemina]|eukprot:XP_012769252.1 hypothetical protein BBBOND_0309690 [Babesia bigemina]
MVEGQGDNQCGCKPVSCQGNEELCSDDKCTKCEAHCPPGCKGCEVKCKGVKQPGTCKCCTPRCGCKEDCYASGKDGKCQEKNKIDCKRCIIRCKDSDKCICYFCSCGTKCNGVICSCCSWCDPSNCSGGPCNGYVIGRCGDKNPKTTECIGHVKYDIYGKDGTYGAVYKRNTENVIPCDGRPHPGKDCTDNNCNWLRGELQPDGNCVIKCTYCGKLCGQDNFTRCCTIAIPLVITVSAFLIFRFMLPEKYHAIMTKIRAAFPSSPRHPGKSPINLVGNITPEETNVDRYSAFRPRAYAGLE